MNSFWLKPLAVVLSIFMIIVLLLEAMPAVFPTVGWSTINTSIIALTPWLVIFGFAVFILIYVMRK